MSRRNTEVALMGAGLCVEIFEYSSEYPWSANRRNPMHTLSKLITPTSIVERLKFGDCETVRGNSITFIPAEVPVGMLVGEGRARFGICQFSRERYEAVAGCGRTFDSSDLLACGDIRHPALDHVVQRVIEEAASPGLASDVLIDSLITVAMIELSRYFSPMRVHEVRHRGGLAPWQMRRIADFIEQQTGAPVLAAELAKLCGISERHLHRAFKYSKGQTLHSYVESIRLDRAKAMLMDASLSLSEIARSLGFASAGGFTIAFRRVAGELPSSYRRRFQH